MNDARSASRWLAVLLLTQMVIAPIASFALLGATFGAPGGFLTNAAPHATSFASAILLSLGLALAGAGIAVVLWPVLRPRSERMALSLAILGSAGIALGGVEAANMLSMLSLSKAYLAAAAPDAALYDALRGIVAAQRNWAHLVQLMSGGGILLASYIALFRFRLVPRVLAGCGVLAALCQLVAVAKPLYGGWVLFPLLAPSGLANLLLIGWLLWKPGFNAGNDLPR